MIRRMLLATALAIAMGTPAHAKTLYTPPIAGQPTDGFSCSAINVSKAPRHMIVSLLSVGGDVLSSKDCAAVSVAEGCVTFSTGYASPFCRIEVDGSASAVRGSIKAFSVTLGRYYLQIPAY